MKVVSRVSSRLFVGVREDRRFGREVREPDRAEVDDAADGAVAHPERKRVDVRKRRAGRIGTAVRVGLVETRESFCRVPNEPREAPRAGAPPRLGAERRERHGRGVLSQRALERLGGESWGRVFVFVVARRRRRKLKTRETRARVANRVRVRLGDGQHRHQAAHRRVRAERRVVEQRRRVEARRN